MVKIPQLSAELQEILITEAEKVASSLQLIQRQRCFTASKLVQTLVFGWMHNPAATLEELARMASAVGVPVTAQGLEQRFTPQCAEFLEQLLLQVICRHIYSAHPIPELARFSGVYIIDSSVLMLPKALQSKWKGCGGSKGSNSGLKIHAGLEFKTGQLQIELTDASVHDVASRLHTMELPAQSLKIADLGYFDLENMATYDAHEVYWLSRFKLNTVLSDASGKPIDLIATLKESGSERVELKVLLGKKQVPCRLLACRVNLEESQRRYVQHVKRRRRKQRPPSPTSLALSSWTILLTNSPDLPFQNAFDLYRVRWQIELLFKLWKQDAKIDEWRTQKPWRILSEIYAKLIGVLCTHWIYLSSFWDNARLSMFKVSQSIRRYMPLLVAAFNDLEALTRLLDTLPGLFAKTCNVNSRRGAPAMWQRLRALEGLT